MIIDEEDYIQHHGVLGMKWGIRHDPKELAAKREKKAQKYYDKASEHQSNIDKAKASRSPFKHRTMRIQREKRQQAIIDAEMVRRGKMTDRQRKIAIGAGSAATTAAAYGTYRSLNSGNARRLATKGKQFITRDDKSAPWKTNPELARPGMTEDDIFRDVVQHVNPGYGDPGTKVNCRRATYAYEMRRRGYDVAATKTTNGLGQDLSGHYNATNTGVNLVPPGSSGIITRTISETYNKQKHGTPTPFLDKITESASESGTAMGDIKIKRGPEPDAATYGSLEIRETLAKMPPGARGELGMVWRGGGGHSMSWENIGGKPVIFDNQTGHRYSTPSEIKELADKLADAGITRLDDKPLNNDFLMRWVKNA